MAYISRRGLIQGAGALGAAGLAGPAFAQSAMNWKKFAGQKIEVTLVKSPRADIIEKGLPEFKALTGLEVGFEQIPEQQARQKQVIELTSGKPSFDVIHESFHVQKRLFEKSGWVADLSGLMADASITGPETVESDFSSAGLMFSKNQQGKLRALPQSVDYWIVYYNKELFDKKGVKYPDTFEEMIAAAEKLTDPKEGVYGFVARGLKNANLPVFTSFLLGFGVDPVDAKGNLMTDTPEAIEAGKIYQRLLSKHAPPGAIGFNWSECQSAFMQGKVAMWLDGIGFAPPLEDPNKSRIVGKVGYGLMPKGPKTRASATFGDGLSIPSASTKKEAAWLFAQWAVSKEQGRALITTGSGVPFRHSVLNDPSIRTQLKMPAAWLDTVAESAKISRLGLPVIIPVTEFRDTIGIGLTNTLSGGDVAAELKKASDAFRPVLEKSEKG
ncbi:MAG: sugar ABC transporter substrate-binding protein [Methylobacteriaceae bacterium]|nr:sugar ABC transporter substrate-binding protein [Methylobacteriaceae bacterium]